MMADPDEQYGAWIMKNPTLASVIEGIEVHKCALPKGFAVDDILVATVTSDSRELLGGALFFALVGGEFDGHDFLLEAVRSGCCGVFCKPKRLSKKETQRCIDLGVAVIEVDDTAGAYATAAANYHGRPAEQLTMIGITGTNGKTTVTYLVEDVLKEVGIGVGVIGTVNNRYTTVLGGTKIIPTRFTTPEAFALQGILKEMVESGVSHVIMEVSSHALSQARIGSLSFSVGAFTNLSRDHLDYHLDMDDYLQAKLLLFKNHLSLRGIAVLPESGRGEGSRNYIQKLYDVCLNQSTKIISWGREPDSGVRLLDYTQQLEGTKVILEVGNSHCHIHSPLVGHYNIENIMVAFGICKALDIEDEPICQALSNSNGAPGRVERITAGEHWQSGGPTVLVDYAHTPDALMKVLETVKELPHRNLVCVFGCGGDRDKGKRPEMGSIVARLADVAIVTDDNPRTEDPEKIVTQIKRGIESECMVDKNIDWLFTRSTEDRGAVVIRDRSTAILEAVRSAGEGDVVVIAGKGHEPYQLTIQGRKYFEDCRQAKNAMFSWTVSLVAEACAGTVVGDCEGQLLGQVVTDSREKVYNGIFVALKGENHDAHKFLEQAVESGCRCLIVERAADIKSKGVTQITVADSTRALGDLAAFRRKRLAKTADQILIGLTGSCGKTTVKEMVAAILQRKWPEGIDYPEDAVLKTKGNYNNLVGLPLSLLPINVNQKAVVLEMGMNASGEIARLAEIADPDISCITNIHGAHLEGLGSIKGVAQAKEELFSGTREDGTLVVNLDDEHVRSLSAKYSQKKVTFGRFGREYSVTDGVDVFPDLWASNVQMGEGGVTTFILHHGENEAEVHLFIAGEHNVQNSLCAAAIGVATGVSLEQVVAGLADFRPPDKRMQMEKGAAGFTLINDTYNANPASMAAGLKTLKQLSRGRTVALIGDMLELGKDSATAHYEVGKLIARLDIDEVGVVGEFSKDVVLGGVENGLPKERIRAFGAKEAMAEWMKACIEKNQLGLNDAVLVKASRGLRFETLVADLLK